MSFAKRPFYRDTVAVDEPLDRHQLWHLTNALDHLREMMKSSGSNRTRLSIHFRMDRATIKGAPITGVIQVSSQSERQMNRTLTAVREVVRAFKPARAAEVSETGAAQAETAAVQ
jgi:hypothetical protein